jgi:hypothetical protein
VAPSCGGSVEQPCYVTSTMLDPLLVGIALVVLLLAAALAATLRRPS